MPDAFPTWWNWAVARGINPADSAQYAKWNPVYRQEASQPQVVYVGGGATTPELHAAGEEAKAGYTGGISYADIALAGPRAVAKGAGAALDAVSGFFGRAWRYVKWGALGSAAVAVGLTALWIARKK